jgi:hypothetical protein
MAWPRALAFGFALTVSAFAPTQGEAALLAGHSTASTTGSASSAWEGQIGAENFVLSQSSTVNQLGIIAWYRNGIGTTLPAALNSINWYLYTDSDPSSAFGTPSGPPAFASGFVSSSLATITDFGPVPQAPNLYNFWRVLFPIPDTVLGIGDYWVGFQVTRNGGFDQIYWSTAASGDGLNAIYNASTASWDVPYQFLMPDTVFEVIGVASVPVPGTFPLVVTCLGLMGVSGWRRRKHKARAPERV